MTCPACTLLQLLGEWVKLKLQILVRRVKVTWLQNDVRVYNAKLEALRAKVEYHVKWVRAEEAKIEEKLRRAGRGLDRSPR
jgi:hypothetical protein